MEYRWSELSIKNGVCKQIKDKRFTQLEMLDKQKGSAPAQS